MQPLIAEHAPSGFGTFPSLPWGSHIGQLYRTPEEMCDVLVPYFHAGLANNERCLWVTGSPLDAAAARKALRAVVPDLEHREKLGDIEIQDLDAFYDRDQPLEPAALVNGLLQREREAIAAGYTGVRTNGNCGWVEEKSWDSFADYESRVQEAVRGRRLICMCSYSHDSYGARNLNAVAAHHDLILRDGRPQNAPPMRAMEVREEKPPAPQPGGAVFDFQEDLNAIEAMAAVPTMLAIVSRTTGMGFSAIARVTPERWMCLAVHDEIDFGLKPGGELQVDTTLCHEVRQARDVIAIDHVAEDVAYCKHHTPAMYGFQSYISMPIFNRDGQFWGTLCAIDPNPAKVKNPLVLDMFRMFADLVGVHLDTAQRLTAAETRLIDERVTGELREQFIAVLGHDLRNPLAAITAGTRMLSKEELSAKGRNIIELMEKSAYRMGALVEDVMDLARARLGNGIQLAPSNAPLAPVLALVVDELRTLYPERRIETEFALTRATFADPHRVGRLLSNLLGNAIRYSPSDTPIHVRAQTYGSFTLSVINQGPAIPPPTLAKLFAPFVRGEGNSDAQGLGLGLYIVSQIAAAHNGTINVTSTNDATIFTFAMPLPPEPRHALNAPRGPTFPQ